MNIIVVVAHPDIGSFNRAIADTAVQILQKNGHNVIFHDLYQEDFDPVLPGNEIPKSSLVGTAAARYCSELSRADGIVIVHPNWWGQPPAILKGWIDRVFRPGVAYEFKDGDSGDGIPLGLLPFSKAIVFNTSNTPKDREAAIFGDPLERLWKNCIFDLCGVRSFYRKTYGVIVTSTPGQRKEWLCDVQRIVEDHFPGD
jgi:NAD(P)H dehydrogenase (quinone)